MTAAITPTGDAKLCSKLLHNWMKAPQKHGGLSAMMPNRPVVVQ